MNSDTTLPTQLPVEEDVPVEGEVQPAVDPFAVDLFAVAGRTSLAAVGESGQLAEAARGDERQISGQQPAETPWHARLPRLSREHLRLSASLSVLPPTLTRHATEALSRVIARYANVSPDEVEVSAVSQHETGWERGRPPFQSASEPTFKPKVWTALMTEPARSASASLVAELDAEFAATLIDLALGGDGTPPETLRQLTRTEQAVVEFLWLAVIREMNHLSGEPLWHVAGVTTNPRTAFDGERSATSGKEGDDLSGTPPQRFIVSTARLRVASLVGICRIYLDLSALHALDIPGNPLFRSRLRAASTARLDELKRFVPGTSLRLFVGETRVAAAEVTALQSGDVVIIERPAVQWNRSGFSGRTELRAGVGRGVVLHGRIESGAGEEMSAPAVQTMSSDVRLLVEMISSGGELTAAERIEMEEEVDGLSGEDDAASGVALEQLLLTVHVELAARRISLDELTRLRAGQLLDLGCRPTDPVELVADGRRIARGELVDFEGRLGVRITEVSV